MTAGKPVYMVNNTTCDTALKTFFTSAQESINVHALLMKINGSRQQSRIEGWGGNIREKGNWGTGMNDGRNYVELLKE